MSKKLKRKPCSLGWTDHSFNRLKEKIINGTILFKRNKLNKKRKFISQINELLFHKEQKMLPF